MTSQNLVDDHVINFLAKYEPILLLFKLSVLNLIFGISVYFRVETLGDFFVIAYYSLGYTLFLIPLIDSSGIFIYVILNKLTFTPGQGVKFVFLCLGWTLILTLLVALLLLLTTLIFGLDSAFSS